MIAHEPSRASLSGPFESRTDGFLRALTAFEPCPLVVSGETKPAGSQTPAEQGGTDLCLPCLQTAERVLPAVFALLEAAVEVLAADADRSASTSIDDEEAPRLPASCACSSYCKDKPAVWNGPSWALLHQFQTLIASLHELLRTAVLVKTGHTEAVDALACKAAACQCVRATVAHEHAEALRGVDGHVYAAMARESEHRQRHLTHFAQGQRYITGSDHTNLQFSDKKIIISQKNHRGAGWRIAPCAPSTRPSRRCCSFWRSPRPSRRAWPARWPSPPCGPSAGATCGTYKLQMHSA